MSAMKVRITLVILLKREEVTRGGARGVQLLSTEPRASEAVKKIAEVAGLAGESACPTLVCKALRFCGAGAFACQLIF
jgi:hypothetical protein